MSVSYETMVIEDGNHASIAIPDQILLRLGTNRRAPLLVTVNGHTYQSTATAVGGQCRVVFPMADRNAARVTSGQKITVALELDSGHRLVEIPPELSKALRKQGLERAFEKLTYSKRKSLAKSVSEARQPQTKASRVEKVIQILIVAAK